MQSRGVTCEIVSYELFKDYGAYYREGRRCYLRFQHDVPVAIKLQLDPMLSYQTFQIKIFQNNSLVEENFLIDEIPKIFETICVDNRTPGSIRVELYSADTLWTQFVFLYGRHHFRSRSIGG